MTHAVLLFSGGLDSTVLLAQAAADDLDFLVLEYDYPGRPRGERRAATTILRHYDNPPHLLLAVPSITRNLVHGDVRHGYIPLRNLWFHATAALIARQTGATRILAGHLDEDAEAFQDARTEYFQLVQDLLEQARQPKEPRLTIQRPFQKQTKADLVRLGQHLGAPIQESWSCYLDREEPCGTCQGCVDRTEATA